MCGAARRKRSQRRPRNTQREKERGGRRPPRLPFSPRLPRVPARRFRRPPFFSPHSTFFIYSLCSFSRVGATSAQTPARRKQGLFNKQLSTRSDKNIGLLCAWGTQEAKKKKNPQRTQHACKKKEIEPWTGPWHGWPLRSSDAVAHSFSLLLLVPLCGQRRRPLFPGLLAPCLPFSRIVIDSLFFLCLCRCAG